MKPHARWLSMLVGLLALANLGNTAAATPAQVEAKLIYGTDTDGESKGEMLASLEPRFKPDFGFKYYRLLGEKSVTLRDGESATLELGHEFKLSLRHVGTKGQFHILQFDLFYGGKKLLFFEVSVKQKSEPIFVKGPWTDKGLVIIALTAR